MSGERNEQAENVNLEMLDMDGDSPAETSNASEELAAEHTEANGPGRLLGVLALLSMLRNDSEPRLAGRLVDEIEEFIPGVQEFFRNIRGKELSANGENIHRRRYPVWKTFLQHVQGIPGNYAIISADINGDIDKFIPWLREQPDIEWTERKKKWIKAWLPRWNMFLQARAGQTLVTRCSVYLTNVGFILYIVDLVSDIGTAIYYFHNAQWWQAIVTLMIMYGAIIFHTEWKWSEGRIHCTGAAAWLRYVALSLVNWPDVRQYGALCLLEWKMYKSPTGRARQVPEWHQRRRRVAILKFAEGVCEACPQVMLQFCLLLPDLYGDWTWTDYLRIASVSVSLFTAGAAFVNWEKCRRIHNYTDVPPRELVVLFVWTGPVTVARLVSVALLLSVHPYWVLAGVALHLGLSSIEWYRTVGAPPPPRTLSNVISICLHTLQYFISPFNVSLPVTIRRLFHAVHFLGNTAVTVVWALDTPLASVHPALYTAILCCNAAMCIVGVVGMELHWKYWPQSYLKHNG